MGLKTDLCAQTGAGCLVGVGRPEARDGPDVRKSSDFRKYHYVAVASVVRWCLVVRGLGCVGRPVLAGRPVAVAFVGWLFWLAECPAVRRPTLSSRPVAEASEQLLLLLLALGVLVVLPMVSLCSWSCTSHMFEVVAMSHMCKVTVRRGASSPCVQWRIVKVSSNVLLGHGE